MGMGMMQVGYERKVRKERKRKKEKSPVLPKGSKESEGYRRIYVSA